jgi:translation initiation factor IF-3
MIEFLQKGPRIKISMQFKGREMSFVSKGELVMLNMVKAVEEYGLAEALPKLENKKMFITIKPKSSK